MELPNMAELASLLSADVNALCLPSGRMVGSDGHLKAQAFLAGRLGECGCQPYANPQMNGRNFEHPYTFEGDAFTNLLGVVPGTNRELPPLLVGAHYDSVIDAPCADDNGAAVAIALALATAANRAGGLERDLVIALFDAEEPPYFLSPAMGSNYFYARQVDSRGIHFALIFDLVGHDVTIPPTAIPSELLQMLAPALNGGSSDQDWIELPVVKDAVFMTGAESSTELPTMLQPLKTHPELRLLATLNEVVGDMSDHGVFRRNGVPYLFLSCGRWQHYHQSTDTPDRLNYEKMARIAQLAADILTTVANAELSSDGAGETDHSLNYEISTLNEGLGVALPILLNMLGLSQLTTREDVRQLVEALAATGI